MAPNFKSLMVEATRLTRSGLIGEATRAIQRALGRGSPQGEVSRSVPAPPELHISASPTPRSVAEAANGAESIADQEEVFDTGEFLHGTCNLGAQRRHYKVFVPARYVHDKLPLVVMLHGCTQDPDDFAAGTGMNDLALKKGFLVLYPEQSRSANASRCWNWFKPADQQRGSGEPAILAAMVRSVVEEFGADSTRIYVAGLSAGGAMAAVLANAYPDVFAAVGIHSGLPCGSAHNMMEALSVMKSGDAGSGFPFERARVGVAEADSPSMPVPTIVFHGDRDHTVHPGNGEQVVKDVLGILAKGNPARVPHMAPKAEEVSGNGRAYTKSTYLDTMGSPLVEHWVVHGAGHAWAGGRPDGSYTDPRGPDASREMLRFFLQHSLGPRQ